MTPASIPQAQVDAAMAMLAHYGVPEDKARIALFAAWAATTTPDKDFAAAVEFAMIAAADWGTVRYSRSIGPERKLELHEACDAARQALLARYEAMRVENERLRACLQPFAEAARNASISGQPPFQFCAAGDYERAEAMLNQSKAPRTTLHATETEGRS